MKNLHVVTDKSVWEKHKHNFKLGHYLDLPDGSIVLVSEMALGDLMAFEAETGVTPLPHVLTGEKLPANVVKALAHLGVTAADNSMTAALKITKVHPAFHPSAF